MKGKKTISARDLAYIALFTALLAICAWISVPFAVPFTMQTFAVLLAAGILGTAKSLSAVVLYLALGMVGLPVFSGFSGGLGILAGPTGGYLLGFIFTVLTAGGLLKIFSKNFFGRCLAMAAGLLVCYLFGTLWYLYIYAPHSGMSFAAVAMQCVLPFILPDTAKLLLAAWMTGRLSFIRRNP